MGYLILGSSGFIGSRIVEFLDKKKHVVSLGTNSSHKKKDDYKRYLNYSDLDDEKLEKFVSNFDTIIDASGISSKNNNAEFSKYILSNSIWPYRLALACKKKKVRLIWFSSIHIDKYNSNAFENNTDNYSLSKYLGESLIKNINNWEHNILILRMGNIIGAPGNLYSGHSKLFAIDIASSFVKFQKATIKNNLDIKMNVSTMKSLLNCIENKNYGLKNLSSNYDYKLVEIAYSLKKIYEGITNKKVEIIHNKKVISFKKEINVPDEILSEMDDLVKFMILRNIQS